MGLSTKIAFARFPTGHDLWGSRMKFSEKNLLGISALVDSVATRQPAPDMVLSICLLREGNIMKKSFRLLLGTMLLGAVVAAASVSGYQPVSAGADPVPICPPDGCAAN